MISINSQTINQIANCLLEYEAVKIRPEKPFVWSSGWLSPIYCDNRRLLSFPDARKLVVQGFIETIEREQIHFDGILGVATGAIAYGALIAAHFDVPFAYVRPSHKGHGLENQVEGFIQPTKKYLMIEDLISTGESSYKAVLASQKAGADVIKVFAIFTYGFPASQQRFNIIPVVCLCDFEHLLTVAATRNYFSEEKIPELLAWKAAPESWRQKKN